MCLVFGNRVGWAAVVLCGALALVAQGEDRFALVIGNANYEGHLRLRNPGHDADALERALQPLGFTVLKRKDLELAEMEDLLAEFRRQLTRQSVAWFYFAGHGLEVGGDNYLLPLRATIREENEVKRKCLPMGQVLDALRESETHLNVVVLDYSRDNPLKRSWTQSKSKPGLATITEVPPRTLIAFATAPGAVAADGRENNSPFTQHLCAVLRSRPSQGLELVDVFRDVSRNVKQATNQVPWLNMDASLPRFYLWKPPVGTVASPEGVSAPDVKPSETRPSPPAVPPLQQTITIDRDATGADRGR